ncbi:protein of unknown function [Blastococcus saxobsidens DD2]|uniref:Uncharacterized protein n=1 Tax=Blastococcus saxobsidens (strain DD2) TaxID=1146883 RepID=H6RNX2_BLASD|nr:protein of unknown function [Blastococcus saxobsidens DD2]
MRAVLQSAPLRGGAVVATQTCLAVINTPCSLCWERAYTPLTHRMETGCRGSANRGRRMPTCTNCWVPIVVRT